MLDFRLNTFLSVCQTLNYTRTAEQLNISQPAVSQHIAALEKSYGTKLFSYKNKQLSLTSAGKMLRDTAQIVAHDDLLLRSHINESEGELRNVSIGATPTAAEYLLAAPIARHLKNNPTLSMRFVTGITDELLTMLKAGSLDCVAVEGFFDRNGFDWGTLKQEELVAVSGPQRQFHPCALSDLTNEHLLVRDRGTGTRTALEHSLADHNLTIGSFRRVSQVDSINATKRMIEQGYGISFLFRSSVAEELERGTLREIPLETPPILHRITFAWLKGSSFSQSIRAFVEHLQESYDSQN